MKPAGLLVYINDIHGLGLAAAQGLYLTTAWYWDCNAETRAFAKRYIDKMQKTPHDESGRLLLRHDELS